MTPDHCTCRQGREIDGSEFGPCPYCEEAAYQEVLQTKIERFLRRKYVVRTNRGIGYLEAAVDDLAEELARFFLANRELT